MVNTFISRLSTRWRGLLQHLPSQCAVCHAWPAQRLCHACTARFMQLQPRCSTCAMPMPMPMPLTAAAPPQCSTCLRQPPPLDACITAVTYGYPWSSAIAQFKFQGDPSWAGALAALLHRTPQVEAALAAADWVLPIPLSRQRLGLKINIHSIPQLLKWATNNNKIAFKNSLLEYQDRIQKTYKASLDPLYSMGYSKEYVDKYYTNLQKNIKTKGLNVPGILDLEESGLGTISKKISLSNLQGKTLGGYKVESAQLVQDSSLPLILSPDENYNKIQSTVKLKISKGKDVKEVYVDYYQDSVDISGRTNLNN